ncbi:hypothetical protein EJ02DRAFT_449962 [Clathrospora elynae]|uniref:Uncharacterized protein n=1 Tax=Clathrospora elynae TaxID=706981 RepID=A0A6A5T5J0_9PLEO|nr:hypothetical protein EJ02DRAFT_449962 [Clathrospora elynae]
MPVARKNGPSQRRLDVRSAIDPLPAPVVKNPVRLGGQFLGGRPERPSRWRKTKNAASPSPVQTNNMTPPTMQSKRRPRSAREQKPIINRSPTSKDVELRFSFKTASDSTHRDQDHSNKINRSFTGLTMANDANQLTAGSQQQAKPAPIRQSVQNLGPELTKPKKYPGGYGFSFSDTFMYDSEDYPDTEGGDELEEPIAKPGAGDPMSNNQGQEWEATQPFSQSFSGQSGTTLAQSFSGKISDTAEKSFSGQSATTIENRSFDDLVVLRDVGSFHLARPQRILPCTNATREDTVRSKVKAEALFSKYPSSPDIQTQLLIRLERMVTTEYQTNFTDDDDTAATSTFRCALKLRDFLLKVKEERIKTGELRGVVEHEIEWVEWMVEASRTGVMHVRTKGCRCRPQWEEE